MRESLTEEVSLTLSYRHTIYNVFINVTWHRNSLYSCKILNTSDADFSPFGKRADRKSHSDAIRASFGRATVIRSSVEHLRTTYSQNHAIKQIKTRKD